MSTFDNARVAALLEPRSIAVVGASANPVRIGGRVVKFLTEGGWDGRILPVNRGRDEVLGLRCYPSIDALPEVPDLAILAISADQTADALLQLHHKGVRAAIALAAGFREAGDSGASMERDLARVAGETGIALLGPNSAGFRNTRENLYATFGSDAGLSPLAGSVAVVSQSGGLAGYFGSAVAKKRGVGHKWIIDTGNEIDLEMADTIAYLSADPDVSVIGLITEGVKDGTRLTEALAIARDAGKPVVALKIGTSEAGALAAYSHTGALAGTDGVYDAVFRQYGVYRARTEQEFIDALAMYDAGAVPRGNRVAVFSLSGGVATALVDGCEQRGLQVPSIEPPSDPAIAAKLPASRFENPLDLTGQIGVEPELLGAVLDHVASLPQVDVVLLGFAYMLQDPRIADVFVPAVVEAARRSGKPMIVVGLATEQAERALHDHGILVTPNPTDAVNAVAALTSTAPPAPPVEANDLTDEASHDPAGEVVTGPSAAAELPGIPFVESSPVSSAEEAVAVARRFGGAVVVKGESPALMHKTELGLVHAGVRGDDQVAAAYATVADRLEGIGGTVHVQPMLDGVETVLGLRNDPTFGPVLMVGLGGIFVEILEDVAFGIPPLTEAQALAMVQGLRGYALLAGARGRVPAAVPDLVGAMVALSAIAVAQGGGIAELDINPFIVATEPGRSAAVDAVLVRTAPALATAAVGAEVGA